MTEFQQIIFLFFSVFAICLATGYIPSFSTEVFLAGIGTKITIGLVLPLALLGAVGQTLAKIHLYVLSQKVACLLSYPKKRKLILLKRRYQQHENISVSVLFVSSLIGLPPYYLVNLICGILDTGLKTFASIGFIGILLRFLFCLGLPHLLLEWIA